MVVSVVRQHGLWTSRVSALTLIMALSLLLVRLKQHLFEEKLSLKHSCLLLGLCNITAASKAQGGEDDFGLHK